MAYIPSFIYLFYLYYYYLLLLLLSCSQEMDDLTLQSHIRDTLVLTNPRECPSWDWNLILSLLHVSGHTQ